MQQLRRLIASNARIAVEASRYFRFAGGNKGLGSRLRLAMTHRARLFSLVAALASIAGQSLGPITRAAAAEEKVRTFQVRGAIREIKPDAKNVVIAHEAIT